MTFTINGKQSLEDVAPHSMQRIHVVAGIEANQRVASAEPVSAVCRAERDEIPIEDGVVK